MSNQPGLAIVLLLAGALLAAARQTDPAAPAKPLTEEQKKELEEANKINQKVVQLYQQGKYAEALPLAQSVLEIWEKTNGPDHPSVATSLNNLAMLYESQAQYAKAEPLHQRALKIKEKALGPDHPYVATSLSNLAVVYYSQAQYAKAESLLLRALKIREKAFGPDHPDVATSLNNLAGLYDSQAQYAKAEPLYQHALQIREKALGPDHPYVGNILNNLAMNCIDQKQPEEALAHSRKAQQIVLSHLKATAEGQSEAAQQGYLQKNRSYLDSYLSASLANGRSAYDALLAWKGNLFLRQQRQRAFAAGDPQAREIQARLQDTSRQLARLYGSTPKPGEEKPYQDKLTALARHLEKAEQELATVSAPFLRARERALLKPEELAALLPVDTALIDLLEYWHYLPVEGKMGTWERRYLAWVLRPGKPVAQVELGSATKINELVSRWRSGLPKRLAPVEGDTDPALALRDTVLGPLLPHLEGVKSLLVSPDSQLATVPLAALPGRDKVNYLIEEMEVAVVPFAQAIPDLVGEWRSARGDSMLLVGDVDYGADPGKAPEVGSLAANRQGQPGQYMPLAQTRAEVAAIRDSFEQRFPDGKARQLRKDQATEQAVRGAAPLARWLHLATHGFFAPPGEEKEGTRPEWMSQGRKESQRQVAAEVPGLLSGLALAGANRQAGLDSDDGILTASEVQGLDLTGVEQAVLSACETGLGKSAGGEGLLGLQRGFQLAGCQTVVASLWQVPDKATKELMTRYYENLWDRKMPKGQALREAQLWILRECDDFRGKGTSRGIKPGVGSPPPKVPNNPPVATADRAPPEYWAAWVLSGGWR